MVSALALCLLSLQAPAPRDLTGDFDLPAGLAVTLWAESPALYNPAAIDVDDARLDLVLQLLHSPQQCGVCADGLCYVVIFREQRADLGEAARDHVEDRCKGIGDELLRELGDLQARLAPDLAGIRQDASG